MTYFPLALAQILLNRLDSHTILCHGTISYMIVQGIDTVLNSKSQRKIGNICLQTNKSTQSHLELGSRRILIAFLGTLRTETDRKISTYIYIQKIVSAKMISHSRIEHE